jgi:lysophospholipase L1-like esterase
MLQTNFRDIVQRATEPFAAPTPLLTIFLGANDACFVGKGNYVPIEKYEANIRDFVDQVLVEDALADTKIVLITPPPINIPDEDDDLDIGPAGAEVDKVDPKTQRGYRTYMSKKRYADKIMEIAKSYEQTGQVIGLNFWRSLIDAALKDQGRADESEEDRYHEDRLPGCGLKGAREFKAGYFTDGLHFGPLAYDVLSKALLDVAIETWPELASDRIAQS